MREEDSSQANFLGMTGLTEQVSKRSIALKYLDTTISFNLGRFGMGNKVKGKIRKYWWRNLYHSRGSSCSGEECSQLYDPILSDREAIFPVLACLLKL
jgi:hypothetical protein